MKTTIRHTPETIEVQPLDMARLNAFLNEFFHKDGAFPASLTFHTAGKFALVRQPKPCIIDDEFVGHDISDRITFYIYEREDLGSGRFRGNCFPTHEVSMTLEELKPYLKPAITLAEFTEERRGYNSRIRSNEADWVRYFNKS